MTILSPGTKVRVHEKHWLLPGNEGYVVRFVKKKLRYDVALPESKTGWHDDEVADLCWSFKREELDVMSD